MFALRGALTLCVLAGCDTVFGLSRDDHEADARTGLDAAAGCPAIGVPLAFSSNLQVQETGCSEYTGSTRARAAAWCSGVVREGPPGMLAPVGGLEGTATDHFDVPHLSADGSRLYVRHWNNGTLTSAIVELRRSTGPFGVAHELVIQPALDTSARFGTPYYDGTNMMMFVEDVSSLYEIVFDDSGSILSSAPYGPADLGVDAIALAPNLSADGLRLVFGGAGPSEPSGVYIAERARADDRFGAAHRVTGVPYAIDPWLDAGCAHLYLSLQGTVYSLDRQ